MERRSFIRKTAYGAGWLGGLAAGCGPSKQGEEGEAPNVVTNKKVRWRLASSFPQSLDTIYSAAEVVSARVKQLTGGRFDIRVYQGNKIVPSLQVLDAVQNNNVQMGHSASYYYIGKNPALAFDTAVPFGLTARQQMAWLGRAGGLELTRKLFSDFSILNFPGGNTGVQMGGWFRKEINALEDLKSIRMRIPGLGGKVMESLGATVQVYGGPDIYPALERGAIDAAEWVGPYDDQKLGFHQVAKFYYYPGWWEPGPSLSFYINQEEWGKLPSEYQYALEVAMSEASSGMILDYDAKNPQALQELVDKGVQLRKFPDDFMEAARKDMVARMDQMVGEDATYKKIFEHWNAFKLASSKWFSTSEQGYANFAFKGL